MYATILLSLTLMGGTPNHVNTPSRYHSAVQYGYNWGYYRPYYYYYYNPFLYNYYRANLPYFYHSAVQNGYSYGYGNRSRRTQSFTNSFHEDTQRGYAQGYKGSAPAPVPKKPKTRQSPKKQAASDFHSSIQYGYSHGYQFCHV
ncbi:MAG: hypothetical protein M0R80_03110 [Proteobacteria bacterium]|nr:hypothetical protein [Pseudomonadota bacterium]